MKYVKTVGLFHIFEASKAECGYIGMKWEYPCFCALDVGVLDPCDVLDFAPQLFGFSDSDFGTLEEAEEWCRCYS